MSISFNVKLKSFFQRFNEFLFAYYKRVVILMQKVNAKNKSLLNITILNFLKTIMLNIILKAFIKELLNHAIQRKII